jgi:hypothetical protein
LLGAGVLLAYADRHLVPASLTGWTVSNVSGQVVSATFPVAGLLLVSRRPENRIGWLFVAAGLALGLGGFSSSYPPHALIADPGPWPGGRAFAWLSDWLWVIPVGTLAFVFLLFPTGHVHSPRSRPALWFVGGAFAFAGVAMPIAAASSWSSPLSSSFQPTGLASALSLMGYLLTGAAIVVSVAALVVRFAKSSGDERLQLKWCAAAALVLVVALIASNLVNSPALVVLQNLAFVCLWTAIAIAVLKYRLYDIDRIISRTLAYAIVTGLLVGVYASLVLLATQVLTLTSPVAVAAATLVSAALFSPLRTRVQRAVDRRFNRARYDADQMVAAFAARLKSAEQLHSVQADLVSVIQRALEPAYVSMWTSDRG